MYRNTQMLADENEWTQSAFNRINEIIENQKEVHNGVNLRLAKRCNVSFFV